MGFISSIANGMRTSLNSVKDSLGSLFDTLKTFMGRGDKGKLTKADPLNVVKTAETVNETLSAFQSKVSDPKNEVKDSTIYTASVSQIYQHTDAVVTNFTGDRLGSDGSPINIENIPVATEVTAPSLLDNVVEARPIPVAKFEAAFNAFDTSRQTFIDSKTPQDLSTVKNDAKCLKDIIKTSPIITEMNKDSLKALETFVDNILDFELVMIENHIGDPLSATDTIERLIQNNLAFKAAMSDQPMKVLMGK